MTVQYIGVNRGLQGDTVTTGTSSTSKSIELVVDLSSGATRKQVLLGLEEIRKFILNDRATPFAQ